MGQDKKTTNTIQADPAIRSRGLSLFDQAQALGPMQMSAAENQAMQGFGNFANPAAYFQQNIGTYMDPYTQQVIDQNTADLDRARQMANLDAAGYATQSGAFGGDRAALLEAENNRNFLDSVARSSAQLRSAGFDQASRNLNSGAFQGMMSLGQLAGLGAQERMLPYQQYDFLRGMLSGIPGNQTQTSVQKGSPWSTVLGLTSIAAAPFTGGASLAALPAMSSMGNMGSGSVDMSFLNKGLFG